MYDISRGKPIHLHTRGQKTSANHRATCGGDTNSALSPSNTSPSAPFSTSNCLISKTGLGFWWLAVVVYARGPATGEPAVCDCDQSVGGVLWLSIRRCLPKSDPMLTVPCDDVGDHVGVCGGPGSSILSWLFPVKARRLGAGWVMGLYLVMAMIAGGFVISMVLRWWGLAPDLEPTRGGGDRW